MSILTILEIPDARLRTQAKPVEAFTPEVEQIVSNMFETMYNANGIGLAATQVDIHQQIIVMDTSSEGDEPRVFINPKIIQSEGETVYEEGCLSIPGIYEKVKRFDRIIVNAFNEKGVEFTLEADELLSICIQHEIDHLKGIVFTDRLSNLKKTRALKKLEKLRKEKAKQSKT